jgi:tetratricopeptide (TPR) repeat protein
MSSSTCRSRLLLLISRKPLLTICLAATLLAPATAAGTTPPKNSSAPLVVKAATAHSGELSTWEKKIDDGTADQSVITSLGEIVVRDPTNARAHFLLGRALDMAGFASLAEEEFRQADFLDPTRPGALLELFQSKLDNDDRVGAYKLLGYMAYRFPDDPAVLYMQGLFAFSQGQNKRAEEKLSQALKSPRAVTGVKSMIAALRINQGRYADAIELAEADLAKKPDHFYGNLMKGQAQFLSNRSREALPHLKKAFNQRPNHSGAAEIYARACQQQGLYADALEAALYEMSLTSKQSELEKVKLRVAYLLRFTNAKVTANVSAMARRRLDTRSEAPRLYFALGDVLDRLGRRREAIAQYRQGLAEDPTMARGWYRLARDFEHTGNSVAAMASYMRALELNPEDTQIVLSSKRFRNRLVNKKRDVAWQLKQLIRYRKLGTVSSA